LAEGVYRHSSSGLQLRTCSRSFSRLDTVNPTTRPRLREAYLLGKLILFLVLALGAALYFPKTRPVVLDTFAPVINPVLRWQVNGELNQILRELQTIQREGRQPLPVPGGDFQAWMDRNFWGGESLDGWGNRYIMRTWRDSVGVISRGPDLEIDTPDDLRAIMPIPRERRRR
jgi:hypothetical protein